MVIFPFLKAALSTKPFSKRFGSIVPREGAEIPPPDFIGPSITSGFSTFKIYLKGQSSIFSVRYTESGSAGEYVLAVVPLV